MIAVDTNVVVRYLMDDDPIQSLRARHLIQTETVFVSMTVLLETVWVLGSIYRRSPTQIVSSLRAFAGLPTIILQDKKAALDALRWADGGLGIADALHLAQSRHCDGFATFDLALLKTAKRLAIGDTRTP